MKVTEFGEIILDEDDILEGLYRETIVDISNVNIDDTTLIEQFNSACLENADQIPALHVFSPTTLSKEEFDRKNQNQWFIPLEYQNFDIENFILTLCKTEDEIIRVKEELSLFNQYNMISVLKCLKYLVDTFRLNNIVWGVGRGSSVASYSLYLLGVHKINSLKYQLEIHEFLK